MSDAARAADRAPRLEVGATAAERTGYALERLEDQLVWYERRSARQGLVYRLKVLHIVVAAAIPVVAGVDASAWLTGSLGALIVVVEGFQQLFQFQ